MHTTNDQVLDIGVYVSSTLSVVGCTVVLLSARYVTEDQLKKEGFSRRLVMNLQVADGAAAASILANATLLKNLTPTWCQLGAMLMNFFLLASFMWTWAIAVHLHRVVCTRRDSLMTASAFHKHRVFALLCWGLPLIDTVSLLLNHSMGAEEMPYCWITQNMDRFYFFYFPMSLILIANIILYSTLYRKIHCDFPFMTKRTQTRLLLYVVVFIWCNVWGLSFRVAQMAYNGTFDDPDHSFSHRNSVRWLLYMDAFFSPLQGFLHALVYNLHYVRLAGLSMTRVFPFLRCRCLEVHNKSLFISDAEERSRLDSIESKASSQHSFTQPPSPLRNGHVVAQQQGSPLRNGKGNGVHPRFDYGAVDSIRIRDQPQPPTSPLRDPSSVHKSAGTPLNGYS